MDYCKTCIYYPPSSCDGKPCTQCDPETLYNNCYVNKEDYITKERMNERLAMMHKLYPDAKPTNADRIRSMRDEELAEFMCHNVSNGTVNCAFCAAAEFCRMGHNGWIDWLKEESEGEQWQS